MSHDFMQFAYVTNDFDRAIEEIRSAQNMGPFKEMRDLHLPTGPGREAVGHFGVAFKAGMQFEIIQPLEGDIGIYQSAQPAKGFELRFHHIGQHISCEKTYRRTLEQRRARWPIPIDMAHSGGFFSYADARSELGHYLELFCFPNYADASGIPQYE